MDWENCQKTRWYQNSPNTWILKTGIKNGSMVWASITQDCNTYTWSTANGESDWATSLRRAMKDARWYYWLRLLTI